MQLNKHSKYYEGILQLRNPTKEILSFLDAQIYRRQGFFISKVERFKNGFDFYVSSKKAVIQIAKAIEQKFGGEIKTSAEHYSRDRNTSRDVYRITVMYRYYGVKKGDIVNIRGEDFKIIRTGRKLHVLNKVTGKKLIMGYGELQNKIV